MSKNKYKVKHRRSRSRNQDKLVATRTFIIITIILVFVLAGILAFKNYYTEAMRLKDDASTLKSSIALCIEALKTGDSAAADNAIAVIDNTSASMRSTLAEPQWKIPHMIPDLGHDMDTCVMCLDLVDKASDTVLKPASEYIKEPGPITADVIDLDNMGPEMGAKLYLYSDMIDTLCPLQPVLNKKGRPTKKMQRPQKPAIYLCTPIRAFRDKWGITDSVIVNGVIPVIRRVAERNGLPVIDLHSVVTDQKDMTADMIHPNANGAGKIAKAVADAIKP